MKVKKIIRITQTEELEITGITLLSAEEAKQLDNELLRKSKLGFWWLRSPGDYGIGAAFVDGDYGLVNAHGLSVLDEFGVRPALRISNLSSFNFHINDKFDFAGYTWTIISNDYALCDDYIGEHCFRKEWKAKDANDYEASDIKKYIENWYKENMKENE